MKWINVKDKLPKLKDVKNSKSMKCSNIVLAYDGYSTFIATLEKDNENSATVWRGNIGWDYFNDINVTHWMPLPKPPKRKK